MGSKRKSVRGLNRREILKYGLYGGLTMGLSGSLWLTGCSKKRYGKGPSIILITVDTLRPDYLSCYGYSKNTSPNIDQFAADGLLFENCLSHAPETRLSIASILSGFLPHETKVTKNILLTGGVETIAEILQRQGYKTAAVISNYVLRKNLGYEQGFMIYDDTMDERELVRRLPERIAQYTTDRAIELLKRFRKDSLFIWIHYQDPHGPYTPPKPFNQMFRNPAQKPRNIRVNTSVSGRGGIPSYQMLGINTDYHYYVSQYEGEIRYQDTHFKRLIDALKQLDLYDDALIILSSDHGEGMGEHDYYFAHSENLYSHLTHVPLIVKYGKELAGRRTDFVQHIDIVPTIFSILGLEADSRFRGRDLREPHKTNREIFAEMNCPFVKDSIKFSIVTQGLKLIHTPLYQQYELFDLKGDPQEKRNLISEPAYGKDVEDMKKRLNHICKEDFLDLRTISPYKLTEEEIRKLKSLGYTR
jgi:arylsulfatase A-like enzyme